MKTLLQTNTSSPRVSISFKVVSILFILFLNVTHVSAQTSLAKYKTRPVIIPAVQSQAYVKAVSSPSTEKAYTIYIAKDFPLLGATQAVLSKMDDSENFNYDEIFNSKISMGANTLVENTSLALNYKTQKQINS